jgi:signal transduction histidine kinase
LLLSCSPFRTNVVPLTSGTTTQQSLQTARPDQVQAEPLFSQQRAVVQQQQHQESLSSLKASSIVNWGQSKQRYLNTAEQTARANVYQDIVQKESAYAPAGFTGQWDAEEGPIRPLWVGSELLLARRVALESGNYIQGAWLHWENLRASLLASIRDLFSEADLEAMTMPLGEIDSRMMASIPVKLITAPETVGAAPFWTPIRISLAIAWLCVLFAGVAVAVLLHGVVSLSERRGDFVSSVTHELRTPLTTFRMYSEMLAEGMVAEEERRRSYLQTLCAESNRLSHLVENVLTYARLERGHANKRRERISLGRLVERMEGRLAQRAEHGGMRLEVGLPRDISELEVETDVSAVEQILFNLVDNACKYAGPTADDPTIHLEAGRHGRMAELVVRDHGSGLAKDVLRRLFKPFSKSAQEAASSAPGVGLGLALCRRLSRGTGAQLSYEGNAEEGARFVLRILVAGRLK